MPCPAPLGDRLAQPHQEHVRDQDAEIMRTASRGHTGGLLLERDRDAEPWRTTVERRVARVMPDIALSRRAFFVRASSGETTTVQSCR